MKKEKMYQVEAAYDCLMVFRNNLTLKEAQDTVKDFEEKDKKKYEYTPDFYLITEMDETLKKEAAEFIDKFETVSKDEYSVYDGGVDFQMAAEISLKAVNIIIDLEDLSKKGKEHWEKIKKEIEKLINETSW